MPRAWCLHSSIPLILPACAFSMPLWEGALCLICTADSCLPMTMLPIFAANLLLPCVTPNTLGCALCSLFGWRALEPHACMKPKVALFVACSQLPAGDCSHQGLWSLCRGFGHGVTGSSCAPLHERGLRRTVLHACNGPAAVAADCTKQQPECPVSSKLAGSMQGS